MYNDRDFDRWNDNNNSSYGNRGNNYGRSGSYSDWDFQRGSNSGSRDFDSFNSDYNRNSGGNYGSMYGGGFDDNRSSYRQDYNQGEGNRGRYDTGSDRGGYGYNTQNYRHGNYDSRYGSQDYTDYDRNRNWNRNSRNDRNDRNWWDKTKDEVASWFGDDDAERRRRMDERREDNHRGKGPKNYTRSSDRIKEDVSDRLSDAWDIDASDIDVSVDNNEVTLSGTVPSKQQKRRAEDIADSVSGVKHVQNNLRVKQDQDSNWNNNDSSTSGSSFTGSNTGTGTTGSSSMTGTTTGSTTGSVGGSTTGSTSSTGTTTGSTGTSSSTPSNQVKIEKSSAS